MKRLNDETMTRIQDREKRGNIFDDEITDIVNDFTMHYLDGGSAIEEFGYTPDINTIDWRKIEKNLQSHYDLEEFKFNKHEQAEILQSLELETERELEEIRESIANCDATMDISTVGMTQTDYTHGLSEGSDPCSCEYHRHTFCHECGKIAVEGYCGCK